MFGSSPVAMPPGIMPPPIPGPAARNSTSVTPWKFDPLMVNEKLLPVLAVFGVMEAIVGSVQLPLALPFVAFIRSMTA